MMGYNYKIIVISTILRNFGGFIVIVISFNLVKKAIVVTFIEGV
jgi:hypothetical protein